LTHPIAVRSQARLAGLAALAALSLSIAHPGHAAVALGDSAHHITRVHWKLSNGMNVILQHIPDGRAISITVGYPGGSDQDPPARTGLAALLAELQFTAAAGDVPERNARDLTSQRPAGHEAKVARCFTLFSEVATRAQFPGVLHQVAERMRGVQVTPASLSAARDAARLRYHAQFEETVDVALYYEALERASGRDEAAVRRMGALPDLDRVTVAEVEPLLARAFSSRNAVVSVAGNLEGLELRPILEHEFGPLAGGTPPPLPPIRAAHPVSDVSKRAGLAAPAGVLGIQAPALTDSTHPAFYVAAVILGTQSLSTWGQPRPPLTSRFQYSVLEDPDLIRFYPPVPATARTGQDVADSFNGTLGSMDNLIVDDDSADLFREGLDWLVGGPLPERLLGHMRTESWSLILLSTSIVERELRGGDTFWDEYRHRLSKTAAPDIGYWLSWMRDPKKQAALLLIPG
jgi:hypothetical protein